jgi:MSHA biogenesis protein MshO
MKTYSTQPSTKTSLHQKGVTLIEMVIVIAITAAIASAVAVFMRRPVEGYVDAARRAELTDIADTALRRITRDLRRALPNSIRVSTSGSGASTVYYLEYLQTSGGGRYRSDVTSTGTGDPLDFTAPDTSFDVIGPMPSGIAVGDLIVVYNLGSGSGATDAYTGGNTSTVGGVGASSITIGSMQFPFASPGKRFQSVSGPVTYYCAPDPINPASGTLRRISGYAVTNPQPINIAAAPLSGAPVNALLATNVAACRFVYSTVTQRSGTVAMDLQIVKAGGAGSSETVRLFQQVNINNVP